MRLYLIRHAESLLNAQKIHQAASTPLHERGFVQIDAVAKRLLPVGIDAVLASPYERTKVTAEHIAKYLGGMEIDFIEDLEEIRRPGAMHGKTTTDPDVLKIQGEIVVNYSNPDYRFSDEETFNELKARGLRVLKHAVSMHREKVLAVTHAGIMRVIIAAAMFGPDLTPREYQGLWSTVIDNTGITILEYDPKSMPAHPWKNPWRIITLNDAERVS